MVPLAPGVNSSVLVDLIESECFGSNKSSEPEASGSQSKGRKPTNKREQLWRSPVYVHVDTSAAYPGVRTSPFEITTSY